MPECELTPEKCETCLWFVQNAQSHSGECHLNPEPLAAWTDHFCSHHRPRVASPKGYDFSPHPFGAATPVVVTSLDDQITEAMRPPDAL
jgi:hypothetical protein